jgi:putative oligomerization/nucleic acid binding protein
VIPSVHGHIVLLDSATAATLAQVFPVLLLTLMVEMRRTKLNRTMPRLRLGAFFLSFAVVETLLVLSIDGAIYPFQWFDLASALAIFGLLSMLFALSLTDVRTRPAKRAGGGDAISKLERLARLRDDGVVSDDEFEQQKRKILGDSTS